MHFSSFRVMFFSNILTVNIGIWSSFRQYIYIRHLQEQMASVSEAAQDGTSNGGRRNRPSLSFSFSCLFYFPSFSFFSLLSPLETFLLMIPEHWRNYLYIVIHFLYYYYLTFAWQHWQKAYASGVGRSCYCINIIIFRFVVSDVFFCSSISYIFPSISYIHL